MEVPRLVAEECLYDGNYLHLHLKQAETSSGEKVNWEMVSRPPHGWNLSGTDLIATLKRQGEEYLLLVLEHRYPIRGYVVSFPGGIDEEGDGTKGALRELKEETGYTALPQDVVAVGPLVYVDPWKSNEKSKFVQVNVREDLPENQNPTQNLDPLEVIEALLVKKHCLLEELNKISQERNCGIDSRLYAFAMGIYLGQMAQETRP